MAKWPGRPSGRTAGPHTNECWPKAVRVKTCAAPANHDRAGAIRSATQRGRAVPTRKYLVIVRGRLSTGLVAAFEGFEVAFFDRGLTHLVGLVPDQEVLHRLFRVLQDLNIELVSVNPVCEKTVRPT